jgi:hypothetical protein
MRNIPITFAARAHARKGLNAIVGSPFRVKQIMDGKEGVVCAYCRVRTTPVVSMITDNLHCRNCEQLLYDGKQDKVIKP